MRLANICWRPTSWRRVCRRLARRWAGIASCSSLDEPLRNDYTEAIPSLFQEFLSSEAQTFEQTLPNNGRQSREAMIAERCLAR